MWSRIRVFFKDSETLVWARIQMLIGVLVVAAAGINWSTLLDTSLSFKQIGTLGGIMLVQGIVTEVSRRLREPHDLGVKTVADLDAVALPIKTADKVDVDPASGTITVTKAADIPASIVSKAAGEKT